MTDVHGKIVTFYSYKGGTGRTMALANTAWILAANGRRVLVADWDLESPGLHRFFRPFLDAAAVSATPGIIDMITEYQWATMSSGPRPPDWHRRYADARNFSQSLEWDFPGGGRLDFMSAGRQNPDYSSTVATIDWDSFYDEHAGGMFFDALRDNLRANYDYCLIDSRTGLSDVADICTVHMPDVLVDCFTLSDQGIEGAAAIAQDISTRFAGRNIRILPVPMRIDEGEKEKVDAGRALARSRFEGLPAGMDPADTARYWGGMEVPYRPFYAYEETLATFGDPPGQASSILSALERLTGYITEGAVSALPPVDEAERLKILRSFTRRRPARPTDLVVAYVPEDRMWADWMAAVLGSADFTVSSVDVSTAAERPEPARHRTIAVLSQHYARYRTAIDYARAVAESDPSGNRGQLIPIMVGDVRTPLPPLTDRMAADISSADAPAARIALARAVDLPTVPVTDAVVRYPGSVPPIWNVQPRNANFTGRNAVLEHLRDQLAANPVSVVLPVALHGLGGVGKTQVALEYAHRFKADYDLVWWVDAEQPDQVSRSLAELAGHLGLRVGESFPEAARETRDALRVGRPHQRWLLVFDNANDPADLEAYLPTGGKGHVLITSRNPTWTQTAAPLEVDVFARTESVDHLIRRVPKLNPDDAVRMAEMLGDLPLAIDLAAAWLADTGAPVADYMELLERQSATRVLALNRPSGYPQSIEATWQISVDRLRQRSPAAMRLLELCSFFAPDISVDLIYAAQTIEALAPLDGSLRMPMMLGRVTQELGRLGLARIDLQDNAIQVHRLVQSYVRDQLGPEEHKTTIHEAHKILAAARPLRGDIDDPRNWPQYQLIWPHLAPSQAVECDEAPVRQLLIDRVRYQWKVGDFEPALRLGAQLDAAWIAALAGEVPQAQDPQERALLLRQLLYLRSQIANIHRSQGEFGTAERIDREVLAEQRSVLPEDDMHTLITAGNLGADLRALGRYTEALSMDKATYDSFKQTFGEENARTLAAANNLAVSYRLVGDFFTARDLDRVTLDRRRQVLGHEHPYSLTTAANLARDLRETGEYGPAIDLLQQTYDVCQAVLRENFTETLRTATSLAAALRDGGEHMRARALTEDTYGRYRQEFDADTPDAYACRLNLAADYAATDDGTLAVEWARNALDRYRQRLGLEHPYTLAAMNNLGVYLWRIGEFEEALATARQCAAELKTLLGPEHPYTITATVNLANCLASTGDPQGALPIDEDAYTRFRHLLGDDHPDTLVVGSNQARSLDAVGQHDRAAVLAQRVLPELARRLGENHPTVRAVERGRRIDREIEPQPV